MVERIYMFELVPLMPCRKFLGFRKMGEIPIKADTKEEARRKLTEPPTGYRWKYIGSRWRDNKGLHLEASGEEFILSSSGREEPQKTEAE